MAKGISDTEQSDGEGQSDRLNFSDFEHATTIYQLLNGRIFDNPPLFRRRNTSYMRSTSTVRPAPVSHRKSSQTSSLSSMASSIDSVEIDRVIRTRYSKRSGTHAQSSLAKTVVNLEKSRGNETDDEPKGQCHFVPDSINIGDIEEDLDDKATVELVLQQPCHSASAPVETSLGTQVFNWRNQSSWKNTPIIGIPFNEEVVKTSNGFLKSDLSVIVKVTIAKRSQRKSERKNSLRSSVSNGESPEKILSGRNSPNADNGCEIQLDAVINGLSTPKKGLISRRNGVLSPSAGRSPPAKRSKLDTLGESEKSKEQLAATRAANSSDETCDNSVIYSIKVSVYMGNGRFCFPEGSYNLRLQKLERNGGLGKNEMSPSRRSFSLLNLGGLKCSDMPVPNCTISFRVVPQQKLRGRTNVRSSISAADSTGNNNNWMFLNGVSKAKFHEVEMKLKKLETRNSNLQLANDQQAAKWIRLAVRSKYPAGFPSVSYQFMEECRTVGEAPQKQIVTFITKPRVRNICPFCQLKAPSLYALLKHLRLCHARFIYTYKRKKLPNRSQSDPSNGVSDEDTNESADVSSAVHYVISVQLNDKFDGSNEIHQGLAHKLNGCSPSRADTNWAKREWDRRIRGVSSNPKVRRRKQERPCQALTWTQILVRKRHTEAKTDLKEFLVHREPNSFQRPMGHCRQYYSSRTLAPVYPDDLNYDSDDDVSEDWIIAKNKQLIEEFCDVNAKEKEFMQIWNGYVLGEQKARVFAEKESFHPLVTVFVKRYGRQLVEKSLTKTFLLHLAVMEEQDVISEEELAEVCEAVGKLVDDPKYTASFECESS